MINKEFKNLVSQAIDKLEKQGEKCVDHYGGCQYFNEKGQSCIVGHMMPEDVKLNTFDGDVEDLEWAQELFSDKQIGVLMDLQYEHDRTPFKRAIKNMRIIESGLDKYPC